MMMIVGVLRNRLHDFGVIWTSENRISASGACPGSYLRPSAPQKLDGPLADLAPVDAVQRRQRLDAENTKAYLHRDLRDVVQFLGNHGDAEGARAVLDRE